MQFPGFVGPSYALDTYAASLQRAVNLYPQADASGAAKAKVIYRATPGLHAFATGLDGDVRGLWSGGALLYAVAGAKLYSLDDEGAETELGTVADDGNPVQMVATQDGLAVCSANKLYWWGGVSLAVVQIDAVDMTANALAFLDGYFIAVDRSEDPLRFRHSGLFDAETWDALDFAAKEAHADALSYIFSDHQDLHLFGTDTIETWRNNYQTAPESFPWERDPGAIMNMGVKAVHTVNRLSFGLAWIGGDQRGSPIAFRARGYSPERISTPAVEEAWSSYSAVDEAVAFSYFDGGHEFWCVNFYNGDATWVYDVTTGLWHERADQSGGVHRARCHTFQFGKHLVGDYETGTIWEMSREFADENGADVDCIRVSPYIHQEEARIYHHRLQVDMQADEDLDVSLEWTNDSGRNWTAPVSVTTGPGDADGETRAVWRRLGEARHRAYRVTVPRQVAHLALIDANLRLTPGSV